MPSRATLEAVARYQSAAITRPITWVTRRRDSDSANLPACPYRLIGPDGMQCEAEERAPICADDCLRCTIPEALQHPKACLYLLPLRLDGEPIFVCRAYSSKVHALASRNWRDFCFCNYWFPRGDPDPANEASIPGLAGARRRYRAILSTPPAPPTPPASPVGSADVRPEASRARRLRWRGLIERLRLFWLWR
ncbi:hypothetical protein [Cupriavidus sp. TMH.W2]|uniref:hypothetical protein n=1 Tax=Cupriavidus sp. TMH.W2 TaxID=3434465 RepID=UPI003D77C962